MQKKEAIEAFKRGAEDTGSPEVQVAILSKSIDELTEHMRRNPKDFHSLRGLRGKVSSRRKWLNYLKSRDEQRYKTLIERLGLRS